MQPSAVCTCALGAQSIDRLAMKAGLMERLAVLSPCFVVAAALQICDRLLKTGFVLPRMA